MINEVRLIGRIGQIDSGRTAVQNIPYSQFSVVTTRKFKDKKTQEWKEHNEWHQVVSYRQAGEHIGKHFNKGDLLYLVGELRTRKWRDRQGVDRYTTEIHVMEYPKKLPRYYTKEQAEMAASHLSKGQESFDNQPMPERPGVDDFDDDIPF